MLIAREVVGAAIALSWGDHRGLTDMESFLEEEGIEVGLKDW